MTTLLMNMDWLPVCAAILNSDCNRGKRAFLTNFETKHRCCVKKNIDVKLE